MMDDTAIDMEGLDAGIDVLDMDAAPAALGFALSKNRYHRQSHHAHRATAAASRRGIKRMIRPENADELLQYLPAPGECTHVVVRGDFVLGDILPLILRGATTPSEIDITSLGMSTGNAQMLAALLATGQVSRLMVLVSHYFSRVDRTGTFREVMHILGDRIKVARNHAKVILIAAPPSFLVIEGSANLRSSDNIEQFAIWNDETLLNWHREWMQEVIDG